MIILKLLFLFVLGLSFSYGGILNSQTVTSKEVELTKKMIEKKEKQFKEAVDKYVEILKSRRKANIERLRQTSAILVLKKAELLSIESSLHNMTIVTKNIELQVDSRSNK